MPSQKYYLKNVLSKNLFIFLIHILKGCQKAEIIPIEPDLVIQNREMS